MQFSHNTYELKEIHIDIHIHLPTRNKILKSNKSINNGYLFKSHSPFTYYTFCQLSVISIPNPSFCHFIVESNQKSIHKIRKTIKFVMRRSNEFVCVPLVNRRFAYIPRWFLRGKSVNDWKRPLWLRFVCKIGSLIWEALCFDL